MHHVKLFAIHQNFTNTICAAEYMLIIPNLAMLYLGDEGVTGRIIIQGSIMPT